MIVFKPTDAHRVLRKIRLYAYFSQRELSEKLNLSQQSINAYETGTNRIPLEVVERWGEACGVKINLMIEGLDLDEFFGEEND